LLIAGLGALIVSDLLLAGAQNPALVMVGAAFWGLHMALTQGVLAAMVAATAPVDLRGTAFGVFNLASGIAMLMASVLAGALWQSFGPASTFYASAVFALVALAGLVAFHGEIPRLLPASR
jgi:MFS family permease